MNEASQQASSPYCQCSPACSAVPQPGRKYFWGHKPAEMKPRPRVGEARGARHTDTELHDAVSVLCLRLARDLDVAQSECDRLDDELGKALTVAEKARSVFDAEVDRMAMLQAVTQALGVLYPATVTA